MSLCGSESPPISVRNKCAKNLSKKSSLNNNNNRFFLGSSRLHRLNTRNVVQ